MIFHIHTLGSHKKLPRFSLFLDTSWINGSKVLCLWWQRSKLCCPFGMVISCLHLFLNFFIRHVMLILFLFQTTVMTCVPYQEFVTIVYNYLSFGFVSLPSICSSLFGKIIWSKCDSKSAQYRKLFLKNNVSLWPFEVAL